MSGLLRPTNPRTHERRTPCALCGTVAALTDTHVPPRAAFNTGEARRSMYDVDGNMLMSRPRGGGIRNWGHCETCRQLTSPWDDDYIGWAHMFAGGLLDSPRVGERTSVAGVMPRARPGRFARAAIAGLTTGAEGLYATHRRFVEDIVAGRPLTGDPDLRFLVAVTPAEERTYVGGGHRGLAATISVSSSGAAEVTEQKATLSALIHFPPFSLLLVDPETAREYLHVDCTHWLELGVDQVVTDFEFAFPAVRLAPTVIVATAESFQPAIV